MLKKTTSGSRLEAREVVVVGGMSKCRKTPPLARIWMRGRWWWWDLCWNAEKGHLWLVFGCEGGGGVAGIGIQWEWGVEDKNGENKPRLSLWLVFMMHLLPPRFYPPLGPCSLRIFAHANGPTLGLFTSAGYPWVNISKPAKKTCHYLTCKYESPMGNKWWWVQVRNFESM